MLFKKQEQLSYLKLMIATIGEPIIISSTSVLKAVLGRKRQSGGVDRDLAKNHVDRRRGQKYLEIHRKADPEQKYRLHSFPEQVDRVLLNRRNRRGQEQTLVLHIILGIKA